MGGRFHTWSKLHAAVTPWRRKKSFRFSLVAYTVMALLTIHLARHAVLITSDGTLMLRASSISLSPQYFKRISTLLWKLLILRDCHSGFTISPRTSCSGVASFLIQGEQQCSKLKISNQCTRFRKNFRQYPCNRLRNYDNLIFQGEHVLQVLPCGDATD